MWSVDGDVHSVPLAHGLDGTRERFCKRVENSGAGIVVGPITDFHFIATIDGHPWFGGFFGNADKNAGVCLLGCQFEDDADCSFADFFAIEPQHSHAAFCFEHAVFYGKGTGPYLLPTIEIFAIKQKTARMLGLGEDSSDSKKEQGKESWQDWSSETMEMVSHEWFEWPSCW